MGRVEPGDELDTDQEDHAFGEVNDKKPYSGSDEPGFVDDYYYGNSVLCKVTSGVVDVFNKDVIA